MAKIHLRDTLQGCRVRYRISAPSFVVAFTLVGAAMLWNVFGDLEGPLVESWPIPLEAILSALLPATWLGTHFLRAPVLERRLLKVLQPDEPEDGLPRSS